METTSSSSDSSGSPNAGRVVEEYWPRTRLSRLRDSLQQEPTFLKVPLNHYKKMIRDNHCEFNAAIFGIINAVTESAQCDMSPNDTFLILTSILSLLKAYKSKLEKWVLDELLQRQIFCARLDHINSANLENLYEWEKIRMNRILVDYMLRMSYRDTARKLTETSNIQELVDFEDFEEFEEARKVISDLQNRNLAPALAWCADKEPELNKYESKLELDLRLQEFIELVRADRTSHALTYARKYLAPWGTAHMKDLKRVLVTLAFESSNLCATHKDLFDPNQWNYLVDQFKQAFYKLYGMTFEPLLHIYLQAGLCVLKTPFGYEDDCTKEDPLLQESFRKLADPLPFSKQYPIFINYKTGEQMGSKMD